MKYCYDLIGNITIYLDKRKFSQMELFTCLKYTSCFYKTPMFLPDHKSKCGIVLKIALLNIADLQYF